MNDDHRPDRATAPPRGTTAPPRGTTAAVWALFVVVVVVPYVGWVDELGDARRTNVYTVFPLLGMWAWSIMWIHYAHGTLVRLSSRFTRSELFGAASGYLVLALILLHPGLLVAGLLVDTGRPPPVSFLSYAGEGIDGGELLVVLGVVALVAFLAFEVLLRAARVPAVQRHWRWVSLSQMVAMGLVFVHGLGLGRHLQDGWLRHWWVVLGALLVPCFAVIGRADWSRSPAAEVEEAATP